jgi:hypothetical protein
MMEHAILRRQWRMLSLPADRTSKLACISISGDGAALRAFACPLHVSERVA